MPVRNVLVCDTTGNIEHNNTALSLDVVTVTQSTELLLTCSVPHVEADCAEVGVELQRVHFNTESGDVLLFELSGQVALQMDISQFS